ncbi:hypothetical protein [Halobacteriovorax sp.]|uniref:hypothetical protein n=1 Tax=Halobacteriovorax sp. TaxID=2020862 RepID=UPI003569F4B5
MKKLITITILSLLSISSFAAVGEGSTECFKNQSTQARVEGKTDVAHDVGPRESEKPAKTTTREQ